MATSKPIIVLIPGGFHSPASWTKVAENLRSQDYEVLTPALVVTGKFDDPTVLAGKTFEDDAAAILKELSPLFDEGKEAVLLGHSYGSVPAVLICEGQTVEERAARGLKGGVRGLVFLAGFCFPVRGKNVYGQDGDAPPMPYHVVKDGVVYLQDEAKALFFSDMTAEEQDAAWEGTYKTQSRASIGTHVPKFICSDVKLPKTWIFTEKDQILLPDYQTQFLQIGGFDKVLKLASGHEPMYSQPEKLTELIVEAASR